MTLYRKGEELSERAELSLPAAAPLPVYLVVENHVASAEGVGIEAAALPPGHGRGVEVSQHGIGLFDVLVYGQGRWRSRLTENWDSSAG